MITRRTLLATTALAASAPVFALSPGEAAVPSRPGFIAAKDIAKAGYIFGLPIVMNYGVMYEYAVDRKSGQYKAPFNQLKNEPTCSPTRTRPSSRPTATRPIRFSGWTCAPSRW